MVGSSRLLHYFQFPRTHLLLSIPRLNLEIARIPQSHSCFSSVSQSQSRRSLPSLEKGGEANRPFEIQ